MYRLTLFCILNFSFWLVSCRESPSLFRKISPDQSGLLFNNVIIENDSVNPIDMEFIYNGGGIGVGDFNNDGLPDLYFTANTVSNKLYLNHGHLSFSDVTDKSNAAGEGEWFNAVSVVDINNDGWDDIYLSASILQDSRHRRNLLYVNQGAGADKIPVFKEMAAEYGLADTSFSVHAAFFDYDNDGDLDMFQVTTKLARRDATKFSIYSKDSLHLDYDRLYRNDWSDSLKHPVFTNVSKEAGIMHPGFGLGVAIADINLDGWKDIYVTNDFYSSDLLYINNKNGTFTESAKQYFKHTSQNAMGNDVADINNDGLADIVAVDMNPEDNYRKKKNLGSNNYNVYRNMKRENLLLQYVRNTLQLNLGPAVATRDSLTHPVFAEIGFYSGIAETDWSWCPSIADFDNDGYRDIIITNGYPKDVTDNDFVAFRAKSSFIASKKDLLAEAPEIKIPNYAFHNKGDLKFENKTKEWGLDQPSFANGAVYVDLDNDGDLDYVINNINEQASLYENKTNDAGQVRANYLEVQFNGDDKNINGFGAWAELYYNGNQKQVYENSPYRGYLSTVDKKAFFGLGNVKAIDSLIIRWPNHKKQIITNVPVNQLFKADVKDASVVDNWIRSKQSSSFFTDITASSGIHYTHQENDYVDFNNERLLPHKLSQYGPGLAAADIDGDGLDDLFIGGNSSAPGKFYLQKSPGNFIEKNTPSFEKTGPASSEDMGILFFDADNDGDQDLYIASGSNEFEASSTNYRDHFYINNGKGDFILDTLAFPANYVSKSCVKAADFDNDGDLDLFVGGRVLPKSYPSPVSSFVYRNDSKNGVIKFTDVTNDIAKELKDIGLVCDALWTDFDNDGWIDLILAGEWMPVTFFKNSNGQFKNITSQSGVDHETGWWNSIAGGDFDNDGDIDYIVGNLGGNSFFRGNHQYPVSIYAKDFDNNKSYDAIPAIFLKDKQGEMKEFTTHNRDNVMEQLPVLKKKYLTYKSFADAGVRQLFSEEDLKSALSLHASNFSSSILINNGNGHFEMHSLPVPAQVAPMYGIITEDFNNDGNLDIAVCGNDFGTEVSSGHYDAMNGLILLGDGKGAFLPQNLLQSGIYIPGDAKALVKIASPDNYFVAGSQNKDSLKVFKCSLAGRKIIPLLMQDRNVFITMNDGRKRKEEVYHGNSFLSQSSPFIKLHEGIKVVEVTDNKGQKRDIK